MKLGFVGVGKHAQRMRDAFVACGAEVVAYDRLSGEPAVGFGERVSVLDMPTTVDAIVACSTPIQNEFVATYATARGKRSVISKPLTWKAPAGHAAIVMVDLWRLYSPAWQALKADVSTKKIKSVDITFMGNGPFRETHNGALDYGPHAFAFALDLLGNLDDAKKVWRGNGNIWSWVSGDDRRAKLVFGNGADSPRMRVVVETEDGSRRTWHEEGPFQRFDEDDGNSMSHARYLALHNFCRAFLNGEPSDTLRISCEAMRHLAPLAETNGPPNP